MFGTTYYIQRIDKITLILDVMAVERKLFLACAVNLNHAVYCLSKHDIIFLMMMLEKLIKLSKFRTVVATSSSVPNLYLSSFNSLFVDCLVAPLNFDHEAMSCFKLRGTWKALKPV
jgi:hypothetical protein